MNKAIRTLLLSLLLSFSAPGFSCGTVDNWMDAYESVESGNKWRDTSNQLEALTMVLNPVSNGGQDTLIGYLHQSVVQMNVGLGTR